MSQPRRGSRDGLVVLDGSQGEGGGQILRTSLTLSLLTGRPFQIRKIRANRSQPGLRPQHLKAVESAAALAGVEVDGAAIGSQSLTFKPPNDYVPDERIEVKIGTAGASALVLHTLHLPIALKAAGPVKLTILGGTFNDKAPSFPFLESTWLGYQRALGLAVDLEMPRAGFYPQGGGVLEATVFPGTPRAGFRTTRSPLRRIVGKAGVSRIDSRIARRMRGRAEARLTQALGDVPVTIEDGTWPAPGPGAALAISAEYDEGMATFVGLGALGKPAETVADEAVDEFLAFNAVPNAAVDPHSADQLLLPLCLAEGSSRFTVSEVTEHLRTNVRTIRAFLDREIVLEEPEDGGPGRVEIG